MNHEYNGYILLITARQGLNNVFYKVLVKMCVFFLLSSIVSSLELRKSAVRN